MTGELYTCIRCGKNRFVPEGRNSLPRNWMILPDTNSACCDVCSEVYYGFMTAFINNKDFAMHAAENTSKPIIEKEEIIQNGSEQAPEELKTCISDRDGSGAKLY